MYFLKKRVVSQMKETVATELISRTKSLLLVNNSFTSIYSEVIIRTRKAMKIKNFFIVKKKGRIGNHFLIIYLSWPAFFSGIPHKTIGDNYTKQGYRLSG